MRTGRLLSLALAAIAALGAAGCARVSDRAGTGSARQLVTVGFGERTLIDAPAADGGSVLDALRAEAPVTTDYGGGFVSGVRGVRSDRDGRRDWFFYVNGVSPGRGADQQGLSPGDAVWWDYRPWGGLMDAWAVVGSWPEPFLHGYPHPPPSVQADPPLDDALRAAGANVAAAASPWRARVGADGELRRRDPAWRRAMADPDAAGLTVAIEAGRVLALGPDGSTRAPVPGGRAVAAAVLTGSSPDDGGVLLAVAGLDAAAARAAAAAIARDPGVLRGRYAVVFDGRGAPIAAGGRGSP